jgi:hypothetical protein
LLRASAEARQLPRVKIFAVLTVLGPQQLPEHAGNDAPSSKLAAELSVG